MGDLRDEMLRMLRTGPKTIKELGLLLDRKVASVKGEIRKMLHAQLVFRSGTKGKEVSYGLTEAGVKQAPRVEGEGSTWNA